MEMRPTREHICRKESRMEDKKVLLSIKDLQVKFRVRGRILTAIRGVTLDIYENESIAIVVASNSTAFSTSISRFARRCTPPGIADA